MAPERVQRKLTTILAADVEGYTRLMRADEEATLQTLGEYRETIDALIARHDGRIFSTGGDSVLAEFGSAVEAVRCAIAFQEEIASRNSELADDRKLVFRIGINVGDVMVRDDDLFGDGVNVAARLEGLAQPGGICVSGSTFEQVKHKLSQGFEDLGPQEVKNLSEPVSAYGLVPGSVSVAMPSDAAQMPVLPAKPSIAVLPFKNMSADPEQEYFSDGITEDIITELSKFRTLFVIARNSSFAFKGQALEIKQISQRLGVRYIVEGSVRRAGNRLRINAQLIDAASDAHLWAERYDRDLEDIFAIQDEVTQAIVTAIEPELASAERERALRKLPESLDAWECYQRGLWHLYRFRAEDSPKAQELFRRAIELDPNFAPAHAALGYALYFEVSDGLVSAPDDQITRALEAAKTAVALDERAAFGHIVLGRVLLAHGEFDASIAANATALAFNPNNANAHYGEGLAQCFAGRPEAAIAKVDEALRLSPHDPGAWNFMWLRSLSLTLLRSYDEAVDWARKAVRQPNATIWAFAGEAVALAHLGRIDEARVALDRALAIKPDLSTDDFGSFLPWKNPEHLAHYAEGLHKAGLPE